MTTLEPERPAGGQSANSLEVPQQAPRHRRPSWARPMTPQTRRIFREEDEEWSTPVAKILQLYYDHESWQQAQEILEGPGPHCRKIGDEARSIAARHIIDRLKEKNMLNKIHKVAPRLRSAVELLSKPDADYVYPHFQYVVNEMRDKYPDVYTSVTINVKIQIPDMKPSHMLVSLAKSTIEDQFGEIRMSWGKFVALLGLCGALAVDSVEAGYPDGVAEIVETFGVITEQAMGEWILTPRPYGGGGWEGFIMLNVYKAKIPPVPRTLFIIFIFIPIV
ncbi:Bcl-2-related ovarian killer protein A [Orchesella cincta]|uniref:Bcl-2-related ovarian killer protein A n=1 Tax=Orchesella cincta TaxID=48709 RepID=A0A1D2NAU1_ORCCI|nr:Bcl-2-related ovarian killer protein A [Orchesella cincta]